MPLIAILRGVTPEEVVPITTAIHDAGWRIVEVSLDSPTPFESIARLVRHFGDTMLVGAGTVLEVEDVARLHDLGAGLVVSPKTDTAVIQATVARGMASVPGVATRTDCLQALDAGAHVLKMFPANELGIDTLRELLAGLPENTKMLPVGGMTPADIRAWSAAGACGFGIGGALYRPGSSAADVGSIACRFTAALLPSNLQGSSA